MFGNGAKQGEFFFLCVCVNSAVCFLRKVFPLESAAEDPHSFQDAKSN